MKAGAGIAALPTFLWSEDVRASRVVALFEDWQLARTEMRVLYPSSRYLAPRLRLFVDAIVSGFGKEATDAVVQS